MILDDIAEYLEDENAGIVGQTIFLTEMPTSPNNILALLHGVSAPPDMAVDLYEQVVDIWSRAPSASIAYSQLESVQDLLHKKANYELANYHVYFSHSLGSIEDFDRDNKRRKLYKLSMRFLYRKLLS